jgi:hypothetical protein
LRSYDENNVTFIPFLEKDARVFKESFDVEKLKSGVEFWNSSISKTKFGDNLMHIKARMLTFL